MKKAILGKKIGMTQIFTEDGNLIPVTVIEAGPCPVVQKKTDDVDGYTAVQVGFMDKKEKRSNKPEKGHFAKANVPVKRYLKNLSLTMLLSLMSAMYSVLTSLRTVTFLMLPEQVRVTVMPAQSRDGALTEVLWLTVVTITEVQVLWVLALTRQEYLRVRSFRVITAWIQLLSRT